LPRILLVDNYLASGKARELEESLASNGASVSVIGSSESTAGRFNDYDGVVLSGSPAMLSEKGSEDQFLDEMNAIKESRVPLLGICLGHQLMGRAYGSRVIKASQPTKKYVDTEVLVKDSLFSGLPERISVYESHYELVETVPKGFLLLARSPTSPIAAMRHRKLPLFGVQFHPERNTTGRPDGDTLIGNFVKACAGYSRGHR
jgi:GMP synthase (glutamine-hydrolysing)